MATRFSRTTLVSALIVATALALVALGLTAITNAGVTASGAAPAAGPPAAASHVMQGHTMADAKPVAFGGDPDGDGYIPANPPVTGVEPSQEIPPHRYFHEFQANCSVTHAAPDDPIVYPGRAGASHDHTFMGNDTTNASSTTASLSAGGTAHSFHYDFFNAWGDATLKAMVDHCVVGGLLCSARGYDEANPDRGAVLDENYELP
ncbi:hypothetical protein [Streptomyces bacillaris]|uniref:hypothetical protein n=1 Tax=Streptomyces bacillaris TaxID=68179 RepID=UPI00346596C2